MIQYKKGDIIAEFKTGNYKRMMHQTNCVSGKQVAGVAFAIVQAFPEVGEALERYSDIPRYMFGNFSPVKTEYGFIYNIYGQYFPGSCKEYAKPDSFEQRVEKMKEAFDKMEFKDGKTLIPLMASGLAADITRKKSMNDLEYFQAYIAPVFEACKFEDLTVMYL